MRMHPQSELENYKLQVELLQEKLYRSEDNRQELEEKLEQIMKKRNEHERTLRSRSQQKYQQFLDEQKKRNERNRKLVEMLERIDQQAAALSARSERLKMMKLQYELYFSKLVQSYSMKTLQGIPAVSFLPIQKPLNSSTTLRTDDTVLTEAFQTSVYNNNNTPQFQKNPLPVVVPIPNEQNRFQPSWTFASAAPGVLIALPNNAGLPISSDNETNKKIQSNFCFDYSQFPIGYLQAAPTATVPMQYNVDQSHLQQPLPQKLSAERHTKPLLASDDGIKQSRPHFQLGDETPSLLSFSDIKTNETIPKRTQSQSNKLISEEQVYGNKPKKYHDLEINADKENGQDFQTFKAPRLPMFNEDLPVSHQSLKVDKLPNIKPNNSLQQQRTQDGRRIVHGGNIPNTIDFRTNDDADNIEYIKYIKEMNETYDKNVPIPVGVTPQEHSIDNITTTLHTQKTEKIDETNVGDDKKINDMEDNERNTSSASSAPFDGIHNTESIGDGTRTFLKKQPLEYKTEQNISNTIPARNIDPRRDKEQITLFNGTKNSKDESTRASNRTTAIMDGDVGENKENTENTRMDPDVNSNPNPNRYRPLHFDKKEKMSIENIETAIYGELLTKPENLTSAAAGLPDNPGGNVGVDKEIERISEETKGYVAANLGQDSYEHQDPEMVGEHQQQVAPYATEIEQIELKHDEIGENNQEGYPYTDNVGSIEEQQYDLQNYGYSDPNGVIGQEGVPQQEYSYNEDGQLLQSESYAAADYQNYDASEYQGEYDPNAYQYDYSQAQYDDPNQPQYTPEAYSQEYQQDPYTGEYANYEQIETNEGETPNQLYTEEGYASVVQEVPETQIEENYTDEQAAFDTKVDNDVKQVSENVEELYEETEPEPDLNPNAEQELITQKPSQPTSILSTEKNSDLSSKKKKRVNFVDSETDESSTVQKQGGVSSESDFEFSTT